MQERMLERHWSSELLGIQVEARISDLIDQEKGIDKDGTEAGADR